MGQFGGGALGIAAGGHNQGVGIGAAGGAQGLAGFGVGGGGNGAGVEDVDVGGGGRGDQLAAGRLKAAGQLAAVGLVQLAAVGVDGNPAAG